MRSKKLVIGLLLLLAVVFTTGTFAYWASGAGDGAETVAGTVTIGSAGESASTVTVSAQSDLLSDIVPASQTGTSSVDLTFPVAWTVEGTEFDGITGNLLVELNTFAIGTLSGTDVTDMFTITVSTVPATLIEGATAVNVVVTIEFTNEPADKTTYDIVAGANLTFNVDFTVTPV
jgi:hypothetical protein